MSKLVYLILSRKERERQPRCAALTKERNRCSREMVSTDHGFCKQHQAMFARQNS